MLNFSKLKYRVVSKIKRRKPTQFTDDFDWDIYSEHYRGELREIQSEQTLILKPNDFIFVDDELKINNKILPLHPNHRLLYETILQLSPDSVMELGCGGGDHLNNLSTLNPNIRLYGIDLSKDQIDFLHQRHPELKADLKNLDITLPHPYDSPLVDIAYTQAVIMHLNTGNNHLVALANLFSYARNQVILMENWKKHNFLRDIQFLFANKMINWDKIFFYYRVSKELQVPHLMIISSVPLKYPILENYDLLERKGV
jgi:SAM-dependent methyltransferase